jgi:D-alanine-D-alanine ligase
MTQYGKVAVMFGGSSAEREVSLMSGNAVLDALLRSGVDAHPFDPADKPLSALHDEQFDRVFIALHGRGGEDGTVQGALELMKLPYTGSGVMASSIGMDKWRTKLVWQAVGIPTPEYEVLTADSDFAAVEARLGLPLMVKPAHEGSSIGIVKVSEPGQLAAAWRDAASLDRLVIAERFIAGREYTAPVLDNQALPLIRIAAPEGNYDYQHKYFTDDTQYFCPCGLPDALEAQMRDTVLRAFKVLGAEGWGRIDLMLDDEGRFYLLEINTSPGMTSHSLVPMAARVAGIPFEALCLRILDGAHVG